MNMLINGHKLDANLDDGLGRAVVISLFSWKRADSGDTYDGTNKFGWWGDTYSDYQIGSKLWQYLRRSLTAETMLEIKEECENALQWLVDTGVCSLVEVEVERSDLNRLNLLVKLEVSGKNISYGFEDI